MIERYITLTRIDDVKRFVDLAVSQPFEIDLVSDRYTVNGKSIMGVFSLDLANPILMRASCDENNEFAEKIGNFLAEKP